MKDEFLVIQGATVRIDVKKEKPDVLQITVEADPGRIVYHFHGIRDSRTHRGVFDPYDPPTRVELIEGSLPDEEAAQAYNDAQQEIEDMRQAYIECLDEDVERARKEVARLDSARRVAVGTSAEGVTF